MAKRMNSCVNDEFKLNLTCLRTDFSSPLGVGNGFTVVDIDSIGPDLTSI